jgi:hypothetical protein
MSGDDDLVYTMFVKADGARAALEALDSSAGMPVRHVDLRPVPGFREQVLTVAFGLDDESEWRDDVDARRRPVEMRLNKWLLRDKDDCREGIGLPDGSLLWWRRGGASGGK